MSSPIGCLYLVTQHCREMQVRTEAMGKAMGIINSWNNKHWYNCRERQNFKSLCVILFIYLDHLYPTSELLLQALWCGDLPPGLGVQTRPFCGCCYFVAKFAVVQQASSSTAWINVQGLQQSYQKLQEVAKSCRKLPKVATRYWSFLQPHYENSKIVWQNDSLLNQCPQLLFSYLVNHWNRVIKITKFLSKLNTILINILKQPVAFCTGWVSYTDYILG